MTSILLVRHAHAHWSPDEMRSLSPKGRLDADRLAAGLLDLPITAVYSSPYRRSLETVSPLAALLGVPVQQLPELRERRLGAFEAMSPEEAMAATWADPDFAHPDGESNREARSRGVAAVRLLASRHPDELVVAGTHGNLLALVLSAFDEGIGFDFWRSLEFPDVLQLDLERSGDGIYRRLAPPA